MTAVSYAQALYSLSVEENISHEIYEQLPAVKFAFDDNPDLAKILDRPCSPEKERNALIDKCFKDVNIYLLNCVKIMSKKRASSRFSEMADEFMRLYRAENGIEPVSVISATPLSEVQISRLTEKLEDMLGKKVLMSFSVDKDIIGGLVVRTESAQFDYSIKTKLEDMRKQIKSVVV